MGTSLQREVVEQYEASNFNARPQLTVQAGRHKASELHNQMVVERKRTENIMPVKASFVVSDAYGEHAAKGHEVPQGSPPGKWILISKRRLTSTCIGH